MIFLVIAAVGVIAVTAFVVIVVTVITVIAIVSIAVIVAVVVIVLHFFQLLSQLFFAFSIFLFQFFKKRDKILKKQAEGKMEVLKAIKERRSIRKFSQKSIDEEKLLNLVDAARLAAFPANVQPLKFGIVSDRELCEKIFPHTKWAGYLKDGTPKEGERPVAYIAVWGDTDIKQSFEVEAGAAVTNILLAAYEMGIATCWIGALDRKALESVFGVCEKYSLLYLVALGYPAQESRTVDIKDGDVKYFMGDDDILRVPKRTMEEILILEK